MRLLQQHAFRRQLFRRVTIQQPRVRLRRKPRWPFCTASRSLGLNAVFGTALRRAPAVNTLRALFQALDPAALETAFRQHARELSEAAVPPAGPRVIALDGKTLKRSFDHLNDKAAAHVLSAFACEAALILAHREVRSAPEEISAAQALIEALGVRGVLFTADALHSQKKPSRARRAPATVFWSGSRPTSRTCTMPS